MALTDVQKQMRYQCLCQIQQDASGEVFLQSGAITAVKCCVALCSDTALCQRASSKRGIPLVFRPTGTVIC